MKIAIISDSHDHLENIRKALSKISEEKADVLIHCGDLCAPFVLNELSKFKGEIHCVFGNTDDCYFTPLHAKELGINFYGDFAKIEIDKKKIFINHFHDIARAFAFTNEFDLVFHGHAHKRNIEKINNTLVICPGEIMGKQSKPSFAIYDTETNEAKIIEI